MKSCLAARTNLQARRASEASRAAFSWGKAKGDVKQLKSVKSGAAIKVEKVG
jgi:hypothetical protein